MYKRTPSRVIISARCFFFMKSDYLDINPRKLGKRMKYGVYRAARADVGHTVLCVISAALERHVAAVGDRVAPSPRRASLQCAIRA